jgi:hypothetical protein
VACIPDLRPVVLEIADRLPYAPLEERMALAEKLRWVESEMYRRPPIRKAPPRSRTMTPAIERQIRVYAWRNPTASQQDISNVFGVIAARVSEALAGKRR